MLMACRNGHLDVVEYLVERCGADIEQAGSGIQQRELIIFPKSFQFLIFFPILFF